MAIKRRHLQHRKCLPRNSKKTARIPTISKEVRAARKLVLDPIVNKLFEEKIQNTNHQLSKNALLDTVNSYKSTIDWITVDILKGKLKRKYASFKKMPSSATTATTNGSASTLTIPPPPGANPSDTSCNIGGRPKGSTVEYCIYKKKCIAMAKNEIANLYHQKCNSKVLSNDLTMQQGMSVQKSSKRYMTM